MDAGVADAGCRTLATGLSGDRLGDGVVAGGGDRLDRVLSAQREGNHDLVSGHGLFVEDALGDPAEEIAGRDAVAGLRGGVPGPCAVAGESGQVESALEEVGRVGGDSAGLDREVGERVLQAVVDLREHARTEFGGEQVAAELHGVVHGEVRRRVEHLHVAAAPAHAHDLGHELLVAEDGVADFVLGDGAVEGDGDHVAVDADDFSCCTHCVTSEILD